MRPNVPLLNFQLCDNPYASQDFNRVRFDFVYFYFYVFQMEKTSMKTFFRYLFYLFIQFKKN